MNPGFDESKVCWICWGRESTTGSHQAKATMAIAMVTAMTRMKTTRVLPKTISIAAARVPIATITVITAITRMAAAAAADMTPTAVLM
ncbi:hypothetical protein GQ54DRAFT_10540 [Martensiomyces pterosporus]|nr:hypothetical protein GQ54DRAFT_10540 [Martensiomyces pterosporus]